jgi:hypothetical protein
MILLAVMPEHDGAAVPVFGCPRAAAHRPDVDGDGIGVASKRGKSGELTEPATLALRL